MERIVLEVRSETARRWRMKVGKNKRSAFTEVDQLLNIWLNSQEEGLWSFLERARKDAEEKGFSDDVLNRILNES